MSVMPKPSTPRIPEQVLTSPVLEPPRSFYAT